MLIFALTICSGFIGCTKNQSSGIDTVKDSLPSCLINDLEEYVIKTMEKNEIPGLSMVIVKGDQVLYNRGFGVRDNETKIPVNTETLFGIGSTTKSLTAIMIASMVDDGIIDWDTPITDILPSFKLSDPQITSNLTFKHTLCMCTGVTRRMEEISVRYSEISAEDIIKSMATIPISESSENEFNYSSRMLATGGYIAALAAGGEFGNLNEAYAQLLQKRLLDPLKMNSSTLFSDDVVLRNNYATPHYSSISGCKAISLEIESMFKPISPAGGMWSNSDDLSRYLIMLINNGITSDGGQIVSNKNLKYLWEPQVMIDTNIWYGLGWYIEDYNGLTVIYHPGGTVGFASELVIIPQYELGFAILTNQLDQVKPIGRMSTYRFLELITGNKHVYEKEIRKAAKKIKRQLFLLSVITKKKVNPEDISPFLGIYNNKILGSAELVLHNDNSLWVDFGEYESEVRKMSTGHNQYIFMESIFMGKTMTLSMDQNENPTMQWEGDEDKYIFSK